MNLSLLNKGANFLLKNKPSNNITSVATFFRNKPPGDYSRKCGTLKKVYRSCLAKKLHL